MIVKDGERKSIAVSPTTHSDDSDVGIEPGMIQTHAIVVAS